MPRKVNDDDLQAAIALLNAIAPAFGSAARLDPDWARRIVESPLHRIGGEFSSAWVMLRRDAGSLTPHLMAWDRLIADIACANVQHAEGELQAKLANTAVASERAACGSLLAAVHLERGDADAAAALLATARSAVDDREPLLLLQQALIAWQWKREPSAARGLLDQCFGCFQVRGATYHFACQIAADIAVEVGEPDVAGQYLLKSMDLDDEKTRVYPGPLTEVARRMVDEEMALHECARYVAHCLTVGAGNWVLFGHLRDSLRERGVALPDAPE